MDRTEANALAFARLNEAEPVLTDIRPAIDALPGMTPDTVLTSGPPMPWEDYVGGQRDAVIGGALFEGSRLRRRGRGTKIRQRGQIVGRRLPRLRRGRLARRHLHRFDAGVRRREPGAKDNTGFCNMYEGTNPRRLNYGVYDEGVRERLLFVQDTVAPVLAEAVRAAGGIPLKPLMRRALHMGDELHSRNTAASLLFACALFPHLLISTALRRAPSSRPSRR